MQNKTLIYHFNHLPYSRMSSVLPSLSATAVAALGLGTVVPPKGTAVYNQSLRSWINREPAKPAKYYSRALRVQRARTGVLRGVSQAVEPRGSAGRARPDSDPAGHSFAE